MTPLGRVEMVRHILEEARPLVEVAAGFGGSERTARKWLARFKAQGAAGLENRSSRSRSMANRTAEPWIDMMESLRREYRLTAEEIATKLQCARSTVAGWLKRRSARSPEAAVGRARADREGGKHDVGRDGEGEPDTRQQYRIESFEHYRARLRLGRPKRCISTTQVTRTQVSSISCAIECAGGRRR
jgi:transposase